MKFYWIVLFFAPGLRAYEKGIETKESSIYIQNRIDPDASCGTSPNGDWYRDTVTDNCFYVSKTLTTWPEAERECNTLDSHLATIQSDNHVFVREILARDYPEGTMFWIGLRLQHVATMTHTWVDGNLSNLFRAWGENEPSSQGTEGCVVMNNRDGKWHDYRCQWAAGYRYICRKKKASEMNIPTTLAPIVQENWGCPAACADCVRFGSSCYFFSKPDDFKSWPNALKACQDLYQHPTIPSKSSSLVSIHNELENEFIVAHMGSHRAHWWTGLYEELDKTSLYWTDHTYLGYTNWHYSEPRISSDAECIWIYGDPARAGHWDDANCQNNAAYICKMEKDQNHPVPEIPETKCPLGFEYMSSTGVCFGILPSGNDSQETCSSYDGYRLATITNSYENAFVRVMFNKLQGYASSFNGSALLGAREVNGRFSWNNGCFPKFNNIANFYSNEQGEFCVAMDYNGKWRTIPCSSNSTQYVVCEKRDAACDKLEPEVTGLCPIGFPEECHDFCYKLSHTSSSDATESAKTTWEGARAACANLGASLVTIRNEKDQQCIQRYLEKSDSNLWIGLYFQDDLSSEEHRGEWKWLDEEVGYQGNYQNWEQGQPDNTGPWAYRETCTEILHENGLWNNVPCTDGGNRGYICEKLKSPLNNDTCGVSNTGDWFYDATTDSCFFVSRHFASWPNAERTCNSMDSHLATIESTNHAFVLQSLTRDYPLDTLFWIGLRLQHIATMTHTWVDGNLSNMYRAWDENEPSTQGAEACVVMNNRNGKWHDFRCQWARGYRFLCRKSKTSQVITTTTTVAPVVEEHWGCPTECTNCVRFGSSCYWFSPANEQKNWPDALKACQNLYAHPTDLSKSSDLISIHNELEQEFIMAHMGTDRISRWTGLHEEIDRTTLYWTDQTYFGYSNWNYREPLLLSERECVLIYGDVAKAGRWNDEVCGHTAGYICKMQKDSTKTIPEVSDPRCPAGFEFLNGVCFGILPAGSNPEATCTSNGDARMATITTPYENAFLRVLFNKAQNFVPTSNARVWLGGKEKAGKFSWNSGCFPKFNNIANFYNNDQQEHCLAMDYNGKWRTEPCSGANQYVACEKREVECEKFVSDVVGVCPPGFSDECHDFCYKISHTTSSSASDCTRATWADAQAECTRLGGSVLSIRNEKDQKCIQQYIEKSTSGMWIGLYEEVDQLTNTGTWKWLDQDVQYQGNYQNWAQGEPNNFVPGYNRESCAEITPAGLWNNVPCGHGATRGYICEKLKMPPVEEANKNSDWLVGGMEAGAIAGLAIAVLLVVPALTVAAYLFLKRRNSPSAGNNSVPYKRDLKNGGDELPATDENDDSFT